MSWTPFVIDAHSATGSYRPSATATTTSFDTLNVPLVVPSYATAYALPIVRTALVGESPLFASLPS